jgi:uncharacterized membrane protein (UPF0127 family)
LQIRTALLLALLATTGIACAGDTPTATIQTKAGPVVVDLEVADTPEKTQRGLMYRTELADGDGMLFIFAADADHSFWMKNTYISLDLIFIAYTGPTSGRIAGIHADAKTLSTAPIRVGTPSRWVLEVPAGWCARSGVAVGDTVELAGVLPP